MARCVSGHAWGFHWGGELIDLAGRHRLTGALYEALRPSAPSRLGHWRRDRGLTLLRALDHLVDERQAERLLRHFEQRAKWDGWTVGGDGPIPSEHDDRETAIIRTVLFQIKDADRLREVVAA